ncbi:DMT family transporter [Microbulbifer bruguierae]|uniref:DMT family transporter n=1 Tax=Microbulbifer bruguierae TaxID=3029061 RepID=A0ABY8N962_9GAMM|nr:DMT family transporter [Microbulbifer bruguierae]WGL15020.1 DMT family transporter [Microbulbifer bruguierae]
MGWLATAIVFAISGLVALAATFATSRQGLSLAAFQGVPIHLWFGGFLSAFGVGMFYFLIPRMGVGQMMSFALTGQILVAMLCSHFGWFDLPARAITQSRGLGVLALVAGIILINWD